MKFQTQKGTTNKLLRVFILDSAETDGQGLTGAAATEPLISYIREGESAATTFLVAFDLVNLAAATIGTWEAGGWVEVDGTNMPGIYEISLPDAAIARGAESVVIFITDSAANSITDTPVEISLTDREPHGQRDADHRNHPNLN